jgi:hypothetical protein
MKDRDLAVVDHDRADQRGAFVDGSTAPHRLQGSGGAELHRENEHRLLHGLSSGPPRISPASPVVPTLAHASLLRSGPIAMAGEARLLHFAAPGTAPQNSDPAAPDQHRADEGDLIVRIVRRAGPLHRIVRSVRKFGELDSTVLEVGLSGVDCAHPRVEPPGSFDWNGFNTGYINQSINIPTFFS